MKPHNPHDALARAVFGQIEHAGPLLRTLLPVDLAQTADWSTLAARPGTYVDEQLRRRHSDLLFSVQVGARPTLLYLLLEHQSSPDRWLAMRILRYELRIWEKWREENSGETHLPAILPVVLYHGSGAWPYPVDFFDLIDPSMRHVSIDQHLPRQAFLLADLSRWTDQDLQREALTALGRVALLSLRDARTETDLATRLLRFSESLREVLQQPTGLRALERVFRYILLVSPHVDAETLEQTLGGVQKEVANIVKTAGEKLIEQGLKKGRAEGREEGARDLLLSQLRARFGNLPPGMEQRVHRASLELLEVWARRLLDSGSLGEVLAD